MINLQKPVDKAVSNRFILLIPAKGKLKVHKMCEEMSEFQFLTSPKVAELPMNCRLEVLGFQFLNKEELVKETPFKLPEIRFGSNETSPLKREPINLESIDLEEIHRIKEKLPPIRKPQEFEFHPAGWSFLTTIITITIIGIALWWTLKLYLRKIRNQRTSQMNQTDD
ncbi:hypothetical protein ABEB36_014782 [Hypothenemus hampei]|uniref:Uncharacterized protein n=1 Tax=Hypothenemus hampei TaxID=57062 RepID=A0ABD1E2V4_HYPHA